MIIILLNKFVGLGRGCGAVIGGFFVCYLGSATTFRVYGKLFKSKQNTFHSIY